MTKPTLISKFFAIGTSGPTVDGREIKASQIDEMAESYDTSEYTANINIEHIQSLSVWGEFPSLGLVMDLKAETDKKGRRVLYAKIEPSITLQHVATNKQKLFTSMEIAPNFAKTGKAYLIGLAVTDRPASLGVEALCFSANNNGPSDKRFKDNLFTPNFETETFTMKDKNKDKKSATQSTKKLSKKDNEQQPDKQTFAEKMSQLLKPAKKETDDSFASLQDASLQLAEKYSELSEIITKLQAENKGLKTDISTLEEKITEFTTTLENTPEDEETPRPEATGENENQTDF